MEQAENREVASPAEARAHLEQLLGSQTFAGSERLRDLLAYLFARQQKGESAPKEYEIATTVFGRSNDFDPAMDSIVRVQANRLRHKLREYYAQESPERGWEFQLARRGYQLLLVARPGANGNSSGESSRGESSRAGNGSGDKAGGWEVRGTGEASGIGEERGTGEEKGIGEAVAGAEERVAAAPWAEAPSGSEQEKRGGPQLGRRGMLWGGVATVAAAVAGAVAVGVAVGGYRVWSNRRTGGQQWSGEQGGAGGEVTPVRVSPAGALSWPSKFSVDGKTVYVGLQQPLQTQPELYSVPVASVGSGSGLRSVGYPAQRLYSVSAKGLLFLQGENGTTLNHVPELGMAPTMVEQNVLAARWDGGQILVVRRRGDEATLESPIGNVLSTSPMALGLPFMHPMPSRDGRYVAFNMPSGYSSDYDLCVLDKRDKSLRVLSRGWVDLGPSAWSPDGREVVVGGMNRKEEAVISAITLEGKSRLLWKPTQFTVVEDIHPNGSMLVQEIARRSEVFGQLAGDTERREIASGANMHASAMDLAGQTLVLSETAKTGTKNDTLYLLRVKEKRGPERLTAGFHPCLSDDGATLLFLRDVNGKVHLLQLDLQTGREQDLTLPGQQYLQPRWDPSGTSVLFASLEAGTGKIQLYRQELQTKRVEQLTTVGQLQTTMFEPNGTIYLRQGSELVARRPDGSRKQIGKQALAGLEIGYNALRASNRIVAVSDTTRANTETEMYAVDRETGERTLLRTLDPGHGGRFGHAFGLVSSDGAAYVYNVVRHIRSVFLLRGIRW